ncbi:hypothetical protein YW3DRAFT_03674, partial [Streptomyces sp. MnatMP-M77]
AAVNRLSTGPATTTAEVQNRARLVQALYLALDRLGYLNAEPGPGNATS